MRDYYSELGVPMDADPVAITKAFRILAMDLHPDRNDAPDAVERFIAIREAFELLIDPSKRRIYDDLRRREAAVGAVSTVDPQKEQYEQWRSDARHRGRRDSEGSYDEFVSWLKKVSDRIKSGAPPAIFIILQFAAAAFFGFCAFALAVGGGRHSQGHAGLALVLGGIGAVCLLAGCAAVVDVKNRKEWWT